MVAFVIFTAYEFVAAYKGQKKKKMVLGTLRVLNDSKIPTKPEPEFADQEEEADAAENGLC